MSETKKHTPDTSDNWGPWGGVPASRQLLCAVAGCEEEGTAHPCIYDGNPGHHHGCIHYDCERAKASGHGLTFREGWGLLCKAHFDVLAAALAKAEGGK